jgi:hypothetical protein
VKKSIKSGFNTELKTNPNSRRMIALEPICIPDNTKSFEENVATMLRYRLATLFFNFM